MNGWSAATTFEGEFSNVTSSYAGKGGAVCVVSRDRRLFAPRADAAIGDRK
jgi:hypothetical protein